MSQPFDRKVEVPLLRPLDREAGEFWVPNPWLFSQSGQNLSMYERNGVFINAGNRAFYDVSFVSGADSRGDGRSVVAHDITGDGMQELFVRQVGGGPLLVFKNGFPAANWLTVSLRGTSSNRFGIGAKLLCRAGGKQIYRELYPIVNFLSQSPALVHFGLGSAEKIDALQIRWPSGTAQELTDLPINRHVAIREGDAGAKVVVPGQAGALSPTAP